MKGERTCSGLGVDQRSDLTKELIREGMRGVSPADADTLRDLSDPELGGLIPLAAATLLTSQTYARAVLAECTRRLTKDA